MSREEIRNYQIILFRVVLQSKLPSSVFRADREGPYLQ